MITKNMKSILGVCLETPNQNHSAANMCTLPVTRVDGMRRYISNYSAVGYAGCFPSGVDITLTLNADASGISIGSGGTAATEDDYQLEETITSGVSMALTDKEFGCDSPYSPYFVYKITVTNTGGSAVTIREIGYKQKTAASRFPCSVFNTSDNTRTVVLIDRTVLDAPLTIQPGDAGTIIYKLSTITQPVRTVADIEMASWTWGTDAQIAAVLDAARLGTIDLQTDAGWKVGDLRVVDIGAFTGGGGVSHSAQKVVLAITSFDEYEGCGNVMQIDFADLLTTNNRMNATDTNVGGYGASEMYTTTLPAMVEALPAWLSSRLLSFSVKAGAGGGATTIETVTGNKLALRSEIEVTGLSTNSASGEGTQLAYYQKEWNFRKGKNLSEGSYQWWLRSPAIGTSNRYVFVEGSSGVTNTTYATSTRYLSPFGCL